MFPFPWLFSSIILSMIVYYPIQYDQIWSKSKRYSFLFRPLLLLLPKLNWKNALRSSKEFWRIFNWWPLKMWRLWMEENITLIPRLNSEGYSFYDVPASKKITTTTSTTSTKTTKTIITTLLPTRIIRIRGITRERNYKIMLYHYYYYGHPSVHRYPFLSNTPYY